MFDVQVKRIHEYKRQHLNACTSRHALPPRSRQSRPRHRRARAFIFGGKAAPGYTMAKLMIKLITSIGETCQQRPDTSATS
jgi:starch phosphorylase